VLDRLVGLETEYAIRYQAPSKDAESPRRFQLYQSLIAALRRRTLVVPAQHFKEGVFTASGGAVWFEAERPSSGAGLVEGATPECRGARQLVTYQRAQDRLLAEAAQQSGLAGEFRLIKNDRDAEDNVYGAQENYEADIAEGVNLLFWRLGLVALLPMVVLAWAGVLMLILGLLSYLGIAGFLFLFLRLLVRDRRKLALTLFGRDLVEGRETGSPTPVWMEALVLHATRVLTSPLALALLVHCRWFAFSHLRSRMTPFLVSRSVIAGAGMVDRSGAFQLADKAPAINCLVGFGGFLHDRPMYTMGHFFKTLCVESLFCWRNYFDLFAVRQRLQIGLGDSNMAEGAEYLRVGTTLLLLDAIEAGYLPQPPRLKSPIRAMRTLCADPLLRAEVPLRNGQLVSALELQRFYLDACRRYLEHQPTASAEAFDILHRWEDALEALVESKQRGRPAARLIGTLDWVTKRYLLEDLGPDAPWAAKKKIDIRYHELSDEGYFQQLHQAGVGTSIADPAEIERAMRVAPPNSPATARGQYIREFSGGDEYVAVNWRAVTLGRGFRARIIRLSRYAHSNPAAGRNSNSSPETTPHES
jgi:Pup amidohydrolase